MKKVFFILILLFSISTIYAERISIENYVVKEISNKSKQETFYLGQTKSKAVFDSFKAIYESESVYLCTMCDGPMNHFHVQLIPRYSYEKRGSTNFVKPRMEYVEDIEKVRALRKELNYKEKQ